MAEKWQATSFPGIRFREHPTRRHGVGRDRYFSIYFKVGGVRHEEGVGWSSQGMNAEKAYKLLSSLKSAHRAGSGPQTLGEKRALVKKEKLREAAQSTTFAELWLDYARQSQPRLRPSSFRREEILFRVWIGPRLGSRLVREVVDKHVEAIVDDIRADGQSERSVQYMLGLVGRLWKLALRRGVTSSASPIAAMDKPTVSNTRTRCFTPDELRQVLDALKECDPDAHDVVLFGALTGARFSECSGLTWAHVDQKRGSATFVFTKNTSNREIPLAGAVLDMLQRRGPGKVDGHVFTRGDGKPWPDVPGSFRGVVKRLGLNEGRATLDRLTFHSLRHTCATLLGRRGLPVRDLQGLLGWKTPSMVFRYSKPSEDIQRRAVEGLEQVLSGETGKVLPFPGQKVGGE